MQHSKLLLFINGVILSLAILFLSSCGTTSDSNENSSDSSTVTKSELQLINEAIETGADAPEIFVERAQIFLENGEVEKAYNDAMTALIMDSTFVEAYQLLADVYVLTGKMANAEEAIIKALDYDSKNTKSLLKASKYYLILENQDISRDYAKKCIDIDKQQQEAFYLLGYSYMESGDTAKAVRNFERAIEIKQNYFDALLKLGMIYATRSDEIAVHYYQSALNIRPTNVALMYMIGLYYQENLRDFDNAIKTYNQILALDAKNTEALFNIAYINLVYLHQYEAALKMFDKTLEVNSDNSAAWCNRGRANEELGNFAEAKRDYDRALLLDPNFELARQGLKRMGVRLSNEIE